MTLNKMTSSEIKDIQNVIKGYINGEVVSQKIKRLTEPGENYGSILLKVDLEVKDGDKTKVYHAVAKCIPPSKSIQEIFNTKATFPAEIGWYSTVIPAFREFQERIAGAENVIDCFCQYYGSRLALNDNVDFDEHGLILLENLIEAGYNNKDRFKGLDEKTAIAALKSLAAFHAVPIAIRLKDPELFQEKIQKHLNHHDIPPTFNPFKEIFQKPCEIIANDPKVAHLVEKARKECEVFPFCREGTNEPWITAVHTDFWTNNMMVKDGDPPEVKIVDLQCTRYCSLASDIIFFLMTSVELNLVRNQFDDLLKVYYDEFIRILNQLTVDTSIFPYAKFLEEINNEGKNLFPKCMFFIMVCNAKKGTSDDVNNESYDHYKNLSKMFSNPNEIHKEKISFLAEIYSKRKWF